MTRGWIRITTLAGTAFIVAAMLAAAPVAHAAATVACGTDPCDIGDSGGPLTHVYIGSDLSCQVVEGTTAQYKGSSTSGDCGTFISVNGKLYGPSVSTMPGLATPYPAGGSQLVSTSATGSLAAPREVTTKLAIGKLAVTEVDTYAAGLSTYKTRITLTNTGTTALTGVRIYRAADCTYGGDDDGYGGQETTTPGAGSPAQLISISCVENGGIPGQGVESWVPNSVNSTWFEGIPGNLWSALANLGALPNTCGGCSAAAANNAIGVSWGFSISAGASVVRGDQTNLATNGKTPLTEFVAADSGKNSVNSGSSDGYTITVHNPTTGPIVVGSITDYLPTGFTYRNGSTTLVTTSEPSISSGVLTWNGSFIVAARSDIHLHFGVQVSNLGGKKYSNAVSGTATGHEIAPSGPSAQITVAQVYRLTVTRVGSGVVTSSPAGIKCPTVCAKAYTGGTVKLTATKALGSVFSGWSGDCAGKGSCTLAMTADHTATATFTRVCTKIAYVTGKDIVTVDGPGGGGITNLTNGTGTNFDPAWSPNCSKIAFASTRNGNAQIFVLTPGVVGVHQITSGLRPSTQPTWSGDGSKIAFTSARSGKPQIYVVSANGGPAKRITHDVAADTQPDWSPIGPRIVFTGTAGGRAQLYSVMSNGTGLVRLTNSAGTNAQASWSPTGTRLLFISTRDGNAEVYLMSANGSGPQRLTTSTFSESHPTWSPLASSFAFASNRSGNVDVFTRTLVGGSFTNVTSGDPGADTSPAWSS